MGVLQAESSWLYGCGSSLRQSRTVNEGSCRLSRTSFLLILLFRDEPLHPLASEHLTRVDIALGVHFDHVQSEELAGVLPHAAQLAHHLAILAVEEPDVIVG